METNQKDVESLPTTIPEVEALIKQYDSELKAIEDAFRELVASENPAKGIFHASEIHENRQKKNIAEVNRQFAVNRRNRLRMEAEPF
ncbi:hypothetical protein [Halodesulfovibrio sp.]|uniref:hypothetical protein n=1 Tax=Halodesulfovibrio sp. TaxID=1912772 RepID=UPI0025F72154|nr:hypothetical protein [Halodesulfovibrio sp.]MCT4626269.1 hypothetical protein [Halodesulfovibrio sp.]